MQCISVPRSVVKHARARCTNTFQQICPCNGFQMARDTCTVEEPLDHLADGYIAVFAIDAPEPMSSSVINLRLLALMGFTQRDTKE